jgi:uncharacterized membrane protein YphA (DoxX/SURF4 family)
MDPVFTLIIAFGLSLLFFAAGLQKLLLREAFRQVLAGYRLLPDAVLNLASRVIPITEIALAAGLVYPETRSIAALVSALMLSLYGLSIWINLKRGNLSLDCGCQLGQSGQTISPALVYRNAVLACIALLLFAPQSIREVSIYDYGVVGFGIVMTCLLYAILNTQIANATSFREINT